MYSFMFGVYFRRGGLLHAGDPFVPSVPTFRDSEA